MVLQNMFYLGGNWEEEGGWGRLIWWEDGRMVGTLSKCPCP